MVMRPEKAMRLRDYPIIDVFTETCRGRRKFSEWITRCVSESHARYSSDNQSEASIDDQVRICRARAEREAGTVVEVYADHALSGATTNGQASRRWGGCPRWSPGRGSGGALDRISRDQEHTAGIWKTLEFAGTKLITLSEGLVSELHVGLRGTMNAMFLKDWRRRPIADWPGASRRANREEGSATVTVWCARSMSAATRSVATEPLIPRNHERCAGSLNCSPVERARS